MTIKEGYLGRTEKLVAGAKGLTDEQLRAMFDELGIGRLKGVSEEIEASGEGTLYEDVVMILGAERGLWNEAGYRLEPGQRIVDADFSRRVEEKVHELWYEENFPLLVFLIIDLKFGVRRIDDRGLLEIARMVNGPWLFQAKGVNELLEWRLATLRLALNSVLADRGYEEYQVQSSHA